MATPVHIFNIRDSESGGGVDRSALMPIVTSPRVVILVHGYNDDLTAARENYARFLNPEVDLDGLSALPPYAWGAYEEMLQGDTLDALSGVGEVCLFFWPGDKSWGPASFASFPLEIDPARESAEMLVNFLSSIVSAGWSAEVTLISHSLGGRVLLEAAASSKLARLINQGRVRIDAACMMAAAVPVPMVFPGGNLEPAARRPEKTLVQYSGSDWVLALGFPLAETLAFEGFFPEAVGYAGSPLQALWTDPEEMPGYVHGSYWPGEESRSSVFAFLDAGVVASPRAQLAEWNLPEPNALESRVLMSQGIPASAFA